MRRAAWGLLALTACASTSSVERDAPEGVAPAPSAERDDARAKWVASIASANERFVVEERSVLLVPTSTRGAVSVAPGLAASTRVRFGAVFCEAPKPGVRAAVACSAERTPNRLPSNDVDAFTRFLEVLGQCNEVERFTPTADVVRGAARAIEATGRSAITVDAADTIYLVELVRPIPTRDYANECSGHNEPGRPCDPVSSWPTNRVSILYVPSYEVIGPRGAAPFEYPFQWRSAMLAFPTVGGRRDGWFVPHEVFGPPSEDAAQRLARLSSYAPEDEDDALAVALLAASLAVVARDADVHRYAQRFLELSKRRPIPAVHFELRRHVLASRAVMESIAAARVSGADPCPRRQR